MGELLVQHISGAFAQIECGDKYWHLPQTIRGGGRRREEGEEGGGRREEEEEEAKEEEEEEGGGARRQSTPYHDSLPMH